PPSQTATASPTATDTATAATASTPTLEPTATSCLLSPEQTEGPFFLDLNLLRSDIREDREGALLRLSLRLVDTDGCTPIRDAVVNLWHADAEGLYSGFAG